MSKPRGHRKGIARVGVDSPAVNEDRRTIFQESRALADVQDPVGFEPHQPCAVASAATGSSAITIFPRARGVPFRGPFSSIAMMPSAIAKWTVTVALCREWSPEYPSNGERSSAILTCGRHYPENVFHAEGDAGSMMCLNFRHGDNEIRLKDSAREAQLLHAGVRVPQPRRRT